MSTYHEIRQQVQSLTPDEQLHLLSELPEIVRYRVAPEAKRSILELESFGKELWQGIDAQEYVNSRTLTHRRSRWM